jgi:hypothetical protein
VKSVGLIAADHLTIDDPAEAGSFADRLVCVRFARVLCVALVAAALPVSVVGQMRAEPAQLLGTPPVSSYRPHLDDRAIDGETWDYVFWFPSGHRLIVQFQITNAGPGRRTALLAALVVLPDHTTRLVKNSRPNGEWRSEVSGNDVRLSLVRHVLNIGPVEHRVHVDSDGVPARFDVVARAIVPAVRLGSVHYSGSDRYDLLVLAPRVQCTATLEIDGGPPLTLTGGGGIVLHSDSTLADYDQALSVMRLHTFDRPLQSSLLSFVPPERGAAPMSWLLLMRDNQPPEVVAMPGRAFGDLVKEREDPGYTSPRRLEIAAAGDDPVAARVSLSLVGRFDIISWINTAIGRFLARRFYHPVQYLFDASYELHAGSGASQTSVSGKGFGLLWILNQPKGSGF